MLIENAAQTITLGCASAVTPASSLKNAGFSSLYMMELYQFRCETMTTLTDRLQKIKPIITLGQ
jgi:hypothetical protein